MRANLKLLAIAAASFPAVYAQHFQRLGTCPTLGCILPPDQQDFLPGQEFDIRFEVHAPVNGSEANGAEPDTDFTVSIAKGSNGTATSIAEFFDLEEPEGQYFQCSFPLPSGCLEKTRALTDRANSRDLDFLVVRGSLRPRRRDQVGCECCFKSVSSNRAL
jgi:hypothetical protein